MFPMIQMKFSNFFSVPGQRLRGAARSGSAPPSASAERRFRSSPAAAARWDAGGVFKAGSSGRPRRHGSCWMAALFQKFTMKTGTFLLALAALACGLARGEDGVLEELQVETLVKPETCSVLSRMGDTLRIHYTGKLMDGKVIDSSLSVDPLVVELGKRTVIAGKLTVNPSELLTRQKIKATIPSHLAYGKKGYPPTIPAQAISRRELPKHQRDLIVQRYQSGEGYKRISKELNIPWEHSGRQSSSSGENMAQQCDITKNKD
ncbi:hypothetical protein L3Q82_024939, partial [Scortum barcoo]